MATGNFELKISGGGNLVRKLKKLAGSKQRKAVRAAQRPQLTKMKRAVKAAAPVRYGALRKSIDVVVRTKQSKKNPDYIYSKVGPSGGNKNYTYEYYAGGVRVIPEMYNNALESGTTVRRTKSGANRGQIRPTRYMAKTLQRIAPQLKTGFRRRFSQEIQREVDRL